MHTPCTVNKYKAVMLIALLCSISVPDSSAAAGDSEFIVPFVGNMEIEGSNYSFPSFSPDGRYVVFGVNSDIWLDSTTGNYHIYRYDRQDGVAERISVDSDENAGNGLSFGPSMSADAKWVVFMSDSDNLVAGDTNGMRDIFLRNIESGVTTRLTPNSVPEPSVPRPYEAVQINAAGTHIVFTTLFDSFSAADSNGLLDVYVYDIANEEFHLISQDSTGAAAGAIRKVTSISDDGNKVSFVSTAFNIVPGVGNGHEQVYARDRNAGTTELVSINLLGQPAEFGAWASSISGDGNLVLFAAQDNDLTSNPDNGRAQVYLRDVEDGVTQMISVNAAGDAGNDDSDLGFDQWTSAHMISDDGNVVIFNSSATNLDPDRSQGGAAYVHDLNSGETKLISYGDLNTLGAHHISISGNGRYAAFGTWYFLNNTFEEQNCCVGWAYFYDLGPTEPAEMIVELVDEIVDLNLDNGISNNLDAKLNSALDALADMNDSNDAAACGSLAALKNAIEAQSGNKIDIEDATRLIEDVENVEIELGCI